jgi:mono/diheme cytochrome c family protein
VYRGRNPEQPGPGPAPAARAGVPGRAAGELDDDVAAYAKKLKRLTGWKPDEAAKAVGAAWAWYVEATYLPADVAAELGLTRGLPGPAAGLLQGEPAGDPVLASHLARPPIPIRRDDVEQLYPLATVFFVLAPAPAQPGPGNQCGYPPANDAHHYQAPLIINPAVVLPLYGASYTGAGTGDDETRDLLKQLLQEVKQMRQDLAAKGDGGGAVAPLAARDPVAIVRAHCAACHTAGVAEDKGGGFELFTEKGDAIRLSAPDRKAIAGRVRNGTMPPAKAGRLAPADRDALLAAIADGPKKDPAPGPPKK